MNQSEFNKAFTNLTPRQQEVLMKVLAGEKDVDISVTLHITKETVRKHIENICETFGLKDRQDSGLSHRPNLIALFAKYRPELFSSKSDNSGMNNQVLLSYYRSSELDLSLISQLDIALTSHGFKVFQAGSNLRMAKNGPQKIYAELNQADYLLLLLSPLSASSEMVTEEVRTAKILQASRGGKPVIIPLRINCAFSLLNHDLRGYLQGISDCEWLKADDTEIVVQNILEILNLSSDRVEKSGVISSKKSSISQSLQLENNAPNVYAVIPNYPPQPIAEPELPRGQVELVSAFYIDRERIEDRCYEAIAKPGALIRIKAPRQMGKTSLMARILYRAKLQGCAVVPLSFQLAESKIFTDLEQFLRWFCANVALQLDLPDRLSEYWNGIFGTKVACKSYFERYLLANITTPLALGLDEVDVVFRYPELAADFFGLLRAWHEEAKNRDIWKKLRLVVVHSTEVYVPMDVNQSPFNVGLPIELPEFQPEQVKELALRHGLAWSPQEVNDLMAMVGGHPYLVRLAFYHIARQEITLSELLATAPTDGGLYGDHLRRHLWNLEQHPDLAAAVKKVADSDSPVQLESMQGFKLHSMGIVELQGNKVIPRCNLYRNYLRVRLGIDR
ncbi:molecular chaperone Tir [Oscillatoriales cyanobacterium USR001]|nr:molecular chaperone Tir [Oscillatoriales cyanobacterium USR001]